MFYGDSIFELWRGTLHGEPDPRGHGTPEIFHEHFGAKYRTSVFAIAGDAYKESGADNSINNSLAAGRLIKACFHST